MAKDTDKQSRSVLEMSNTEAREFFLRGNSYFDLDLPYYINFEKLLKEVDKFLECNDLKGLLCEEPSRRDDLNHDIYYSKDGKYAWRPLKLIHPALYVYLVQKITGKKEWAEILKRFSRFAKPSRIKCISLPVRSLTDNKDKAEQILCWWRKDEQRSISLALEYEYLIHTDIADCYGSIYTHSIAWALRGRGVAKKERCESNRIGNIIDKQLQDINNGQTNSIPQGSVLMHFIAEMVLGYADALLELAIKRKDKNKDYYILRYRDDYRIFVNNPQDGEEIVKYITEVLISLGLKLNPAKTMSSNQVIKSSIKPDKFYWINRKQQESGLEKHLLIIYNLSIEFPNSGSLLKALNGFYKKLHRRGKLSIPIMPLISIVVDIAYRCPKTYPTATAILSKLIDMFDDAVKKREIVHKIVKKFKKRPNTGYMLIWIQRFAIKFMGSNYFDEDICKLISREKIDLWINDWISSAKLKQIIDSSKIIDYDLVDELPPVISVEEVELFRGY